MSPSLSMPPRCAVPDRPFNGWCCSVLTHVDGTAESFCGHADRLSGPLAGAPYTVALGLLSDEDMDLVSDLEDNCPTVANSEQSDEDRDGVGDQCDNCPNIANPDQADVDLSAIGGACDCGAASRTIDAPDGASITIEPPSAGLAVTDDCSDIPAHMLEQQSGPCLRSVGPVHVCHARVCFANPNLGPFAKIVSCYEPIVSSSCVASYHLFKGKCCAELEREGQDPLCADTRSFSTMVAGSLRDSDGDRLPDYADNCIDVANTDQADNDHDGVGDACESQNAGGAGGTGP